MPASQTEPDRDSRGSVQLTANLRTRLETLVRAGYPDEIAATSRYRTLATVLSDTGERYGSTGMWAGLSREGPAAARETV